MSSSLGQFVFGFAIAFSPAPLVGFGAWSMVNAKEAAPMMDEQPAQGYASPLEREWSDDPVIHYDEDTGGVPEQPPIDEDRRHEMQIETDCARRKAKPIKKRAKPEREIPDF